MAEPPGMTVHQVWFNFRDPADPTDATLPATQRRCQATVRAMCAKFGWAYRYWVGLAALQALVDDVVARIYAGALPWPHEREPECLRETFDMLPKYGQKHDYVRWLILFAHGGLYVDLDVEWTGGDPPPWAFRNDVFLLREAHGRMNSIANCYLYVRAGAPACSTILLMLADHLWDCHRQNLLGRHLVHATGPGALEKIYAELKSAPASEDYSRVLAAIDLVEDARCALFFDRDAPGSFLAHLWEGLWSVQMDHKFASPPPPQDDPHQFY